MKNQQTIGTITGKLYFQGVKAERVYQAYVNPRFHTDLTRSTAYISEDMGSDFAAYNNSIYGTTLLAVPNTRVVQLIKTKHFNLKQDFSILMLHYIEVNNSCLLTYTITNIPTEKHDQVLNFFQKHYFSVWEKHFLSRPRKNKRAIEADM